MNFEYWHIELQDSDTSNFKNSNFSELRPLKVQTLNFWHCEFWNFEHSHFEISNVQSSIFEFWHFEFSNFETSRCETSILESARKCLNSLCVRVLCVVHTTHSTHHTHHKELWVLDAQGGDGDKSGAHLLRTLPTELRVRREGTGTSQQDLRDARFSIQVHLNIDMEGSTAIRVHMWPFSKVPLAHFSLPPLAIGLLW